MGGNHRFRVNNERIVRYLSQSVQGSEEGRIKIYTYLDFNFPAIIIFDLSRQSATGSKCQEKVKEIIDS